ncbi:Type I phosphodiesterase/nucleotide pyrophosphatase [Gracilaria domingensis]|nr:Type I phosphodiesterase/nucleotide pyrophosphatase [Gracilaria domingensis]
MLPISATLPAVTTTTQSTYVTGELPSEHGIVANGWYSREECETKFWKQSNKLVQRPKVWEEARKRDKSKSFTVANTMWWYNMYSSSDYSVTVRPTYPADGAKYPDIWTHPAALRDEVKKELGNFPLFNFWGPLSDITSSKWIANCAKYIENRFSPTLHLVYLPHLDYCQQKVGPEPELIGKDLAEIDALVEDLVTFFEAQDIQCILVSEYAIVPVSRPVHINRALREAGFIQTRDEHGLERLDAGASRAFAVADHQVAHVYVNDSSVKDEVWKVVSELDGVDFVLDEGAKKELGLDHERSGDFVAVSEKDAWFTYYYWFDDAVAPDFARCVDIHRKPGFDPVELFIDPTIRFPKLKAAYRLAQKTLGFRYLMDVIPLDASLVKGSHGRNQYEGNRSAMFMTKRKDLLNDKERVEPTEVFELILKHLGL